MKRGGPKGLCIGKCYEIWKQFDGGSFGPFKRCPDCPHTELLPENILAWEIYSRVWNQFLTTGMGEVIGLNLLSVYRVMETFGVSKADELDVLDKVLAVNDVWHPIKKPKSNESKEPFNGDDGNPTTG